MSKDKIVTVGKKIADKAITSVKLPPVPVKTGLHEPVKQSNESKKNNSSYASMGGKMPRRGYSSQSYETPVFEKPEPSPMFPKQVAEQFVKEAHEYIDSFKKTSQSRVKDWLCEKWKEEAKNFIEPACLLMPKDANGRISVEDIETSRSLIKPIVIALGVMTVTLIAKTAVEKLNPLESSIEQIKKNSEHALKSINLLEKEAAQTLTTIKKLEATGNKDSREIAILQEKLNTLLDNKAELQKKASENNTKIEKLDKKLQAAQNTLLELKEQCASLTKNAGPIAQMERYLNLPESLSFFSMPLIASENKFQEFIRITDEMRAEKGAVVGVIDDLYEKIEKLDHKAERNRDRLNSCKETLKTTAEQLDAFGKLYETQIDTVDKMKIDIEKGKTPVQSSIQDGVMTIKEKLNLMTKTDQSSEPDNTPKGP